MAEPFRAVITVPWDVQRTSLNQRLHWRARAERNRIARQTARLMWLKAGKPQAPGKVAVTVTVKRARALDPDAVLSAAKPVIDGLFNEAITPNDSRKWIACWLVEQEVGKRFRGCEEIVFEVTSDAS